MFMRSLRSALDSRPNCILKIPAPPQFSPGVYVCSEINIQIRIPTHKHQEKIQLYSEAIRITEKQHYTPEYRVFFESLFSSSFLIEFFFFSSEGRDAIVK